MGYTTDLTLRQRNFILEKFPEIFNTKSKADIFKIINALFFLIKTGKSSWLFESVNVFKKYHMECQEIPPFPAGNRFVETIEHGSERVHPGICPLNAISERQEFSVQKIFLIVFGMIVESTLTWVRRKLIRWEIGD